MRGTGEGFSGSHQGNERTVLNNGFREGLYFVGLEGVKGAELTGTRTVRMRGDDPLAVYQPFAGITDITRVSEGR